jgi:hypothetical protein
LGSSLREKARIAQAMIDRCMAIIRAITGMIIIPITVNINPNIVKKDRIVSLATGCILQAVLFMLDPLGDFFQFSDVVSLLLQKI